MEIAYRHIESPSHVIRDVIFVDSMAIDEHYRGMGIELQVNAKNSAAYNMYTGYGFTEKSINMELLD